MLETTAANILRGKRRSVAMYIREADSAILYHEKELKAAKERAENNRHLHCQIGAAIQVLEGDGAALDLPEEPQPEQST